MIDECADGCWRINPVVGGGGTTDGLVIVENSTSQCLANLLAA